MSTANGIPVIGFCAWSGTGKTTLLKRLIPLLVGRGLRPGVIKHAHHDFDIDHPGKDSYELRKAGARQMLITSRRRMALITELDDDERDDPSLAEALSALDERGLDLVLVEGFKHESFPKIELHRPALGKPLLFPSDPDIIALASDAPVPENTSLPVLDMNDADEVARFIQAYIGNA